MYQKIQVPYEGKKITRNNDGNILVPDNPIIPFVTGDGIGIDITPVAQKVLNSGVEIAYKGKRKISWMEIYAGEKAQALYGTEQNLPDETVEAIKEFTVAIKGPLTTPVGGGIRSLNVALRQLLDLYVCQRPVRWFEGVPTPVKHPERTNMVVFRENTEDIYAGIEWRANSDEAKKVLHFLTHEMKVGNKIRFHEMCGIGVKPVSKEGSRRLIKAAIVYAYKNKLPSVTLVHKGNIMKFTEGAFKDWGYELVRNDLNNIAVVASDCNYAAPADKVLVKDVIADAFLQQILTRPEEYSVIATLNLNGDYISDALAACVGGIGMAPGANINYDTGIALFEATHGTAPKYAGLDKVNPSSLILSGEMMLRYLGWYEAAELIIKGLNNAIKTKKVTYDLARLMDGATEIKCSEFGNEIIRWMKQ